MSLQRNSALSMRTICFSKPVSELVLQTGLTRPRSWTEEVSDLGRRLFSFEFPAQIETSASREVYHLSTTDLDCFVKLRRNVNVQIKSSFGFSNPKKRN